MFYLQLHYFIGRRRWSKYMSPPLTKSGHYVQMSFGTFAPYSVDRVRAAAALQQRSWYNSANRFYLPIIFHLFIFQFPGNCISGNRVRRLAASNSPALRRRHQHYFLGWKNELPEFSRIFSEVTAVAAALLISTSQSSSLNETGCVSVPQLILALQIPSPLPHVQQVYRDIHIRHAPRGAARLWSTCFHHRDIFRLPDPEKITYLSHGAREMLTFQSSWHKPLPAHWLLVLDTLQVHLGLGFDCPTLAIPSRSAERTASLSCRSLSPSQWCWASCWAGMASFLHMMVWILLWEALRWQKYLLPSYSFTAIPFFFS